MQEQLNSRLNALKREFEAGQTKLQEIDRQQVYLRETLLRISGAIQVLEELLQAQEPPTSVEANGKVDQPEEVTVGR